MKKGPIIPPGRWHESKRDACPSCENLTRENRNLHSSVNLKEIEKEELKAQIRALEEQLNEQESNQAEQANREQNLKETNRLLQENEAALAQLFGITTYSLNSLVGQVEEKKFRLQEQIKSLHSQL